MLMENSNIEIIGGGLFFTEIKVKNDNEKFVPSESDKEAIRKNIEEIECLKIQSPFWEQTNLISGSIFRLSFPIFRKIFP